MASAELGGSMPPWSRRMVPVSSNATAEAVKTDREYLPRRQHRLVNELKVVYEAMGIDVWE